MTAEQGKEEYGIFMLLDKKIWPANLHYFEVLLREGSGPIFQHRGPVVTFNFEDEAEEYAQTYLWLPEVIGWRTKKLGSISECSLLIFFLFFGF